MHFQGQNKSHPIRSPLHRWSRSIGKLLIILCFLSFGHGSHAQRLIIKNNGERVVLSSSRKGHIFHRGDGNNFNIEYKGKITVSNDDKDVIAISNGGYLEIDKTTFGSKRSILIEHRSSGLSKQYYEGRKEQPWEPYGREWLAEILPDILRSTGIAAHSRIDRFYRKGGTQEVLDEIGEIDSDLVKTTYFRILLRKKGLSANDLISILNELEDEVDSDHYLAKILEDNSRIFLKNEKVAEAYFDVVSDISSSHYASGVLKEALRDVHTSGESLKHVIAASKDISSDYHQAKLLSEALEIRTLSDEMISEIVSAVQEISSDYYQTELLKKALELENISYKSLEEVIEAVSDVSSDYYMATVFSDLLDEQLNEKVQVKIIHLVEDEMSSDYYASQVLSKVLEEQNLSDQATKDLVEAISEINSSSYASSIIKKAAENQLDKATLLVLLEAIEGVDSDHYRSEALTALAPQIREGDSELKDAYRKAARHIRSDTYYGRAIRALD